MTAPALVAVIIAYLLGSIDFAVLVSRARGVDIYQVGSGNPGAANVLRQVGRGAATLVVLGDALKGFLAAWLGEGLGASHAVGFAAGLAAVVGHCWPLWHGFRGGKGVATAAGMLLRLAPLVGGALALVYLVAVRLTGISSVGSLSAALLSVPALAVAGRRDWSLVWAAATVVLIFLRHHENIRRLAGGQEGKVFGRGG